MTVLWVAIGGAVGSVLRYWVSDPINQRAAPWGTVVVNLVGGFQALGTLMAVGLMVLPAAAGRFFRDGAAAAAAGRCFSGATAAGRFFMAKALLSSRLTKPNPPRAHQDQSPRT